MPGSVAETRYGRRGGGWLPKESKRRDTGRRDRRSSKPMTRAELWPAPTTAAGWEARARMAHGRVAAGAHLDDIDRASLAKFPECPPIIPKETLP